MGDALAAVVAAPGFPEGPACGCPDGLQGLALVGREDGAGGSEGGPGPLVTIAEEIPCQQDACGMVQVGHLHASCWLLSGCSQRRRVSGWRTEMQARQACHLCCRGWEAHLAWCMTWRGMEGKQPWRRRPVHSSRCWAEAAHIPLAACCAAAVGIGQLCDSAASWHCTVHLEGGAHGQALRWQRRPQKAPESGEPWQIHCKWSHACVVMLLVTAQKLAL